MFYILLTALLLGSAFADRVPVMMWTNMESGEFPAVLAGHSVSTVDFERNYVDRYSELNRNLIVFIQNKLSIADISHYANIYGYEDEKDSTFQNVKNLMSEQTSTHLPNVVSPVSVFEGNRRKMKVLSEPYNIDELMSDSASNLGLILVKLSDVDVSDRQNSLEQNDKIIGDVVKQLDHHNIKYTAIYTAVSSGKKRAAQDFLLDGSRGRQLLADSTSSDSVSNASAIFHVDDSICLYLGGLSVGNSSSSATAVPLDLTYLKMNKESSLCSNETIGNASSCAITLEYTESETLKNLSLTNLNLTFSFSKSTGNDWGYWYISSLDLSYTNQSDSGDVAVVIGLNPGSIGAWSPLSYSFSCYSPSVIEPRNKTQKAGGLFVFMKKFQVQAFGGLTNDGYGNYGFGYYNDCEPFFTVGIWMALISMAVMIGILVFGLYMLCQITTMDRFDDPKGKTIIVAAATD